MPPGNGIRMDTSITSRLANIIIGDFKARLPKLAIMELRVQFGLSLRWGLVRHLLRRRLTTGDRLCESALDGGKPLFAMSCLISESLAADALHRFDRAQLVINAVGLAIAVTEIELGKVTMQMLLDTVLIDATHAPLEDAEKAFNGVAVNVALNILADTAKCAAMLCVFLADLPIDTRFIGH